MNFFGGPEPHGSGGGASDAETVYAVGPERWEEFVRWIDPMRDSSEVAAALQELQRRHQLQAHSPPPLECVTRGRRVAGAYMILLGARVAALAGVRAVDNHTLAAVRLLNRLVNEVRAHGVVQVQAILDGTDSVATEIVQLAGFVPLAELQQLVLSLERSSAESSDGSKPASDKVPLPNDFEWIAASSVPREELTALLAHTFVETLDCPELNGLRTTDDVLEGFLDGQTLESQRAWWILANRGKPIGCVLVNRLPNGSAELAYMGLSPSSRGRGYGKWLLEQGIASARSFGGEMFMAAVDCGNWPATRLYLQAGFQEHARVQAWFYRP